MLLSAAAGRSLTVMPRSRGDVAGWSNHNWTTRRDNYYRRRGRCNHYRSGSCYHRRRGRRNHYRSRCNDAFDQMHDARSETQAVIVAVTFVTFVTMRSCHGFRNNCQHHCGTENCDNRLFHNFTLSFLDFFV